MRFKGRSLSKYVLYDIYYVWLLTSYERVHELMINEREFMM